MEGILKSAPLPAEQAPRPVEHSIIDQPLMMNGVPLDIIRHFGIDINKINSRETGQLRETYLYLDGNTIGEKMEALNKIINMLGAPNYNETVCGKVWHYLKVRNQILDLEKQRRAMEYGQRT